MKNRKHITPFIALLAAGLGFQVSILLADSPALVHPGDPQVHPDEFLTVPSFDRLIPTTFPLIRAGDPTVHPTADLVHPTELPLVPKGA